MLGTSDFTPGNFLTPAKNMILRMVTGLRCLLLGFILPANLMESSSIQISQKYRLKLAWVNGWGNDCKNKMCFLSRAPLILWQIFSAT